MSKTSNTVVFFGSGPVAAQCLELLVQHTPVEAVITKPQPPHHKAPFPVLATAERLGLPILTASTKAELTKLMKSKPVSSDVAVLIDYGIIVGQDVIDYFPLGIINSHFSLLPEWRGADPITFSILSGQKQTGVSLMLVSASLDEGPLLAQTPFDMPADITTPSLTKELISLSDQTLQHIIPLYRQKNVHPAPQEQVSIATNKEPTYSRKLTKADGLIDWNKSAEQIEREIRAYIEWPKSRTTLGKTEVIITKAAALSVNLQPKTPGTVEVVPGVKQLHVACGRGALLIENLKPAGKSEMSSAAFIAGYGQSLA